MSSADTGVDKKPPPQTAASSLLSVLPLESLEAGTSLDAQERVFTVTPDNAPTPQGHMRKEMRLKNLWHRASFIVIQYNKNKNSNESSSSSCSYLVQKRSKFKDFGPGLLDGSPGGVLGYGETYLENASREIGEEMGIDISDGNSYGNTMERLLDFSYQDDRVKVYGELFIAAYNGPLEALKLQEAEVEEIMVMSKSEIVERILNFPEDFIPDSLYAMKLYFLEDTEAI